MDIHSPLFSEGPVVYRRVVRPLLWAAFRSHYEDLVRMERELAGSGLDWTAVRPPKLTTGPAPAARSSPSTRRPAAV